jgi:NAD(P)-dependent dehydrogenase (short-subunit alcohol dehydrogenase family)
VTAVRRFEGKVALVTGGNSGMGLAVARRLVEEGAKVVISGRDAASLAAAARELGAAALGVRADVAGLDDVDRLVAATREFGGGRLDVLFPNAGSALFRPLAETTEAQWDALMSVNLKGVYFTVQKALPLLQAGSAIVLNASVAAAKGNPVGSLYGASKAGVRSLGRTFAAELAPRGIRVNVVSPGPIERRCSGATGCWPRAACRR